MFLTWEQKDLESVARERSGANALLRNWALYVCCQVGPYVVATYQDFELYINMG